MENVFGHHRFNVLGDILGEPRPSLITAIELATAFRAGFQLMVLLLIDMGWMVSANAGGPGLRPGPFPRRLLLASFLYGGTAPDGVLGAGWPDCSWANCFACNSKAKTTAS